MWQPYTLPKFWTRRHRTRSYVPDPDLQKLLARYVHIMDEMPPVEVSVSIEQLSALDYTVRAHRPPMADFAIFGKHPQRHMKKMQFQGMMMGSDGTWRNVEILGPGTFEAWLESYDCLTTALIMLDVVRRPRLASYRAHIIRLHIQYGSSAGLSCTKPTFAAGQSGWNTSASNSCKHPSSIRRCPGIRYERLRSKTQNSGKTSSESLR
jgi:hypothetical protein